MTQEEEGGGEYDMYVCEYLAARHSFQGLQAVLRENALGFPPETTPAPVYRRLLWADCCALVAALRSDDSATGAYATLGKCATVLDRLLEQQEQEQPPHDFKQGFALAAFDIFYQDLFRAYGVHADGARMAADVADLAQRCFRSQALLRAAQTALEGTVAAAQLRRDRDAFAALARAAHRHGVAALADAVEEYLRGVERGLAEPLVVQALRGVVRGTHAPQGPAPVAPAATMGSGAESTPADKKKKRKSFSAEEIANLEAGVRRCGVGRWKEILALYHFDRRTTVDLKDKWRNMVNKRAREEQATQATQTTQKQSQESASAASSQTGSSSSTVTPAKRKRVGVTEDGLMALLTPPSSQGAATQDRTPSPASSQPRPDATAAPADDDDDDDGEILSLACADGAAADAAADDDDIEDLLATQV